MLHRMGVRERSDIDRFCTENWIEWIPIEKGRIRIQSKKGVMRENLCFVVVIAYCCQILFSTFKVLFSSLPYLSQHPVRWWWKWGKNGAGNSREREEEEGAVWQGEKLIYDKRSPILFVISGVRHNTTFPTQSPPPTMKKNQSDESPKNFRTKNKNSVTCILCVCTGIQHFTKFLSNRDSFVWLCLVNHVRTSWTTMTIGKNIRARKEGVGGDGIGMRGIPHSARGAREGEREGERETVKETQVAIIFGYCGQGTIEGAKFVCSKKENDSTPQKAAKCTPN